MMMASETDVQTVEASLSDISLNAYNEVGKSGADCSQESFGFLFVVDEVRDLVPAEFSDASTEEIKRAHDIATIALAKATDMCLTYHQLQDVIRETTPGVESFVIDSAIGIAVDNDNAYRSHKGCLHHANAWTE